LKAANEMVSSMHRHHKPCVGHRFSLGIIDDEGTVRGAAIVGRPVSRETSQYDIAEVSRLVTDGCQNGCSALYGACARVAKEMGFTKIQTYILESEPGTSLKASGWVMEAITSGGNWNHSWRKGRREDQPMVRKQRWSKTFEGTTEPNTTRSKMRGQDLTQYAKDCRAAENKSAFDEIIGDPFAKPEPTSGHYVTIKSRGAVQAMQNNFDEGIATRNPSSPNVTDFICDVERTLELTLTPPELTMFVDTYIYELTGEGTFDQSARSRIEQRIGRAFRDNRISPVSKYFTAIRRKINDRNNARASRN
jgi:hypothetical protein